MQIIQKLHEKTKTRSQAIDRKSRPQHMSEAQPPISSHEEKAICQRRDN